MVKVIIDEKEYEVTEGSLILEAARTNGINVPTFCYQKRLTPLASCRMCLVRIEGQPKLAPACVTPISDGMVINTIAPEVAKTREMMLELLLANHPLDCPICDKAGECELQDTVFEYGADVSRFHEEKRVFRTKDLPLNQVIIFNANRCIQCQRCVRMCEEVVGAVALGTMERGMDSEITGFENSLTGCDHCGNCIEVCPVGALMSQPYRYKSRPWDLIETDSTCTFCGTGCQLSIGVRDGQLARVRSKYETGINGETLCVKGRFGLDFIDAKGRLATPMVRQDGQLVPVSWEEASEVLTRHMGANPGQKTCSGLASATLGCETLYLFQKMMRTIFQTNHIDSSNRWSSVPSAGVKIYDQLPSLFKGFYSRQPLENLLGADCILVVGTHVSDDNPVSDYLIRQSQRDRSGRLLIASARPSRLDAVAAAYRRIMPGDEAVLFAALEAALTDGATGRSDPELAGFIAPATALLEPAHKVSLLIGSDILRSPQAGATLQWLQTYAATLHSLGKQVAIQFLFDRGNQMGAWEMGLLPNMLPGWHDIADGGHRTPFAETWKVNLPEKAGDDIHGILNRCAAGDMDMLYCLHSDPMSFYPDRNLVKQALANVKLLVVQASHQSPTTEMADIILPGAAYGEESGTVLNNEGRLQRLHKIRPPIANTKPNLDVFQLVATTLGWGMGAMKPQAVFSELAQLVPSFDGIDYAGISDDGRLTKTPPFAYSEKLNLSPPALSKHGSEGNGAFMLITGECRFHSGGISVHSETLKGIEGAGYVEMNRAKGLEAGLQEGEIVTIETKSGEMQLPVRFNKHFAAKTLFIPNNFPDIHLNQLWVSGQYPCPAIVRKRE